MARKKKKRGKKSVPVNEPKSKKTTGHVGTITVEDQLKMDRAARRQADIEAGTFCRGGIHGEGKNKGARNKRKRSEGRRQCRDIARGGGEG